MFLLLALDFDLIVSKKCLTFETVRHESRIAAVSSYSTSSSSNYRYEKNEKVSSRVFSVKGSTRLDSNDYFTRDSKTAVTSSEHKRAKHDHHDDVNKYEVMKNHVFERFSKQQ